jgi:acyl-CoA thioesterase YciA
MWARSCGGNSATRRGRKRREANDTREYVGVSIAMADARHSRSTVTVAESVTLPDRQPALRVVPMPSDANQNGDIFGGWVMSQVDIAGSVPAARRARGRVATVAVNSFVFREPVMIGDLVSFYADITREGRTSITVAVEVYAQRNPTDVICVKVTEASLTYVAVGADRRPRELPT